MSASYGPYRALFDVTFTVPGGGVTALIGSNGAGKSTVSRVVTGLLASTSGAIRLQRQGHHRAARLQDRPGRDGPRARGQRGVRQPHRRGEPAGWSSASAAGASASPTRWSGPTRPFPVLGERRRQHGGTLSGGEQRMLSLAKVLVAPAQPAGGRRDLTGPGPGGDRRRLRGAAPDQQAGTALLVVEQQVDRVLDLAGTAVVLEHGSVAYGGPAGGPWPRSSG